MTIEKGIKFPRQWSLEKRLANSAQPQDNGCLIWTRSRTKKGYGDIRWQRRHYRAHRLVWELAKGPIPTGLFVCHTCDQRACINIDHLFLGTAADNSADMAAKGRGKGGVSLGEDHGLSKITTQTALEIFQAAGSQREIAHKFGVTQTIVARIKLKRTWRHIHVSG